MGNNPPWGKLFTIEGGDGSGKTEQIRLLSIRLDGVGCKVKIWDFPQYGDSYYGRMAERMLKGEFGQLMSIHPTLAAMVFANDRLSVRDEIARWIERGGIALCNRYADSNLAHGAAKFATTEEATAFMNEIEQLEYGENRLPFPNATFYLATDAELSEKLAIAKGERLYMGGKAEADQAERDLEHQRKAREMYEYLCQTRERFIRIECMKGTGEIDTRGAIHERIWAELAKRL